MEKKINIAELLKDCPKGMELDCTMFDNLFLNNVNKNDSYPIMCYTICDGIRNGVVFTEFGEFNRFLSSKCVIFPKGKTTWEGFQRPFEDGDIVTCTNDTCTYTAIFKEMIGKGAFCHYGVLVNNRFCCLDNDWSLFNETCRFATEEEKQKLFNAIKANGYKWNAETKTLEELVESNEDVDDRVVMSGIYFDRENYADEVELHLGNYDIEIRDGKTYAVFKNQETKTLEKLPKFKVGDRITKRGSIENWIVSSVSSEYYGLKLPKGIEGIGVLPVVEQDDWELVSDIEPKFKVGDRIKYKNGKNIDGVEQGVILSLTDDTYDVAVTNDMGIFVPIVDQDDWELIPNKFDISTLKPFDKVLVRNYNSCVWKCDWYSHYSEYSYPYICTSTSYKQCIPYKGNEHLLGKTDDCDEYYKTWEE